METNYKVYVHINKINGKRYYGITSIKVEKRWSNGRGYKGNEHFTNSIKKYGWNNFEHIVIAKGLTEEEAKWLEIELIREHDTTNPKYGYNVSLGGDMHSEETRKKISKSQKGENNSMYGKTPWNKGKNHSEETRKKLSEALKGKTRSEESRKKQGESIKGKNHPRAKQIYCVELDMYFNTVNEACEYIGCCKQNISSVLNGKTKTAKGMHWLYAEEVNEENINRVMSEEYNSISEETRKKMSKANKERWKNEEYRKKMSESRKGKGGKQIYCVELDKYFNTVTEASKYIGCDRRNISDVLTGRNKTAKGYHWLYAEDVNKENINRVVSEEYNIKCIGKNHPRAKQIYCIELDKYFDTVTEASKILGCSRSGISNVLRGKTKTCGGMHWLYAEDVEKIEIENDKVS